MKKLPLALILLLVACSSTKQLANKQPAPGMVVDGKLFTVFFMQQAAEYRALCLQAYNVARLRVDQLTPGDRPLAIVTDIDETVLDNSAYAVHQGLLGRDYDQKSWFEWTAMGEADTIAGAPSFLKYAASRNISIFYITNRDENEREGTLKNLRRFGLPNADNEHLLLKTTTSGKEARRSAVMQKFNIVLLIGDNLSDMSALFDKKTNAERNAHVASMASIFGDRFIVLPNPNYGDWESAAYRYKYDLTPAQKDSVIRSLLKGY
jgi:5'-nucleotidase (lipoprotein e(P4) family)